MQLSEKQKEFIREGTHRYNIKLGATRSGKTYLDILYVIPMRIRERTGKEGLNVILGVTTSTIERNVLEPLREIYGNGLVGTINSRNICYIFNEPVYCLGAEKVNQVSKIRGSSIKYCYCDELAEYNQEVFEILKSRLDKPYSVLDATLNPEGNNHWLKKDFLDTVEEKRIDCYMQTYTIFDNPFLSKEFIDNLCKEYEGTVYYNRYILGQWCNAEGLIFPAIANDKNRYITKEESDGIISIGIDWGGNGSAHSITATQIKRNYDRVRVLASEKMVATGTDEMKLFTWIVTFIKAIQLQYGRIEIIFCDSAEQVLKNTLITKLINEGIRIPVKDSIKTEISERIKCWTILLATDRISFKEGKANTLIEAMQTAVYDEDAKDDRWLDDGTSDIDSLDSFNYSIEYWMPQLMRRN